MYLVKLQNRSKRIILDIDFMSKFRGNVLFNFLIFIL